VYELNVAQQDGRFEDEGWRVRKDGTRFWANVIITAIFRDKKLIGFAKVSRDLTQRKMTEEVIRESKDRYKLLLDQTSDYSLFALDAKGRIASWNSGAERLEGYKTEEIVGKHFSIFYPREAIEKNHPQYELAVASKEGRYEEEDWRLRKDGSRFWASVVITALYRENRLVGFSKLTRDLSDKKRAEEELHDKQQIEEKLSQTRSRNEELHNFAHFVAHDLKAPLRAISNFSHIATSRLHEMDRQTIKDSLTRISVNAEKMKHVIDGILNYAEIGTGGKPKDKIDLNDFVRNLPSVINLDKHFDLRIQRNMPEVTYPRFLLHQILDNLVSNAVKYCKADRPLIEIGYYDTGNEWTIFVSDNGESINSSYHDKIFEVFQVLGQKNESSSGLGLSIVKKAVESEGGMIWVESEQEWGNKFLFTIRKETQPVHINNLN
jgi:PAS domain S-box-containing protein